jgi:hypothetical protein
MNDDHQRSRAKPRVEATQQRTLNLVNHLRTAMAVLSLAVAGFFSAGLSHGVVWSLTALGAIHGPYTAYRHDTITAAMLVAAVAGSAIGVIGLGCAFASGVRGGDAWFAALQRTMVDIGPLRAFLVVVAVQLCAIIGLETVEQVVQFGHAFGPLAALGAPLAGAIQIHALCALAVVSVLFCVARAVVRAEARLRCLLSPPVYRTCSSSVAALLGPHRATDDIIRLAPLALRFANRPPPSVAA